MARTQKTFAFILGIILLLVGILGFIENPLVGEGSPFGTNTIQDVLHLIAGAAGIYAGTKGTGKGYNLTIGWIGLTLGILGFIPGIDALLGTYLSINTEITILHLVIGLVSLGVGYKAK